MLHILLFFLSLFNVALHADFSLEEKIGQLLIVHFSGESANANSLSLIVDAHVGGFIYYSWANGLHSKKQVLALSQSLQRQNQQSGSALPLFISIDHEGGRIHRFKRDFTLFPSAEALGSLNNPFFAERVAFAMGEELLAAGINVNFAPVVDVNNNPLNIAIGDRSFGSDPTLVTNYGRAALLGYEKAGVIAVLKHFPGHGDVSCDTHHATPLVDKSLEALSQTELHPYRELCPYAPALMTAHLIVSAIDPNQPATFSTPLLTTLLRENWNYEGVVISDSLAMKGVMNCASSLPEAALKALQAGCDILCLGGKLLKEPTQDEIDPKKVIQIHAYLVEAVKKGLLSEKKIDASFERVRKLKARYALNNWREAKASEPHHAEHEQLKAELELLLTLQTLDPKSLKEMGKAIYKNECGSKSENLTFWNSKEDFISLGIGHFIWYPEGTHKDFEEGFPSYLQFVAAKKADMPPWLIGVKGCPWSSRDAFMTDFNSPRVQELRRWLMETMDLQASFIAQRLTSTLDLVVMAASEDQRGAVIAKLLSLAKTPQGIFALIDYMNFKGSGLNPLERYQGEGWGLVQVLVAMQIEDESMALANFQKAAAVALSNRVANAPSSRGEERWLDGWKRRIATYSSDGR